MFARRLLLGYAAALVLLKAQDVGSREQARTNAMSLAREGHYPEAEQILKQLIRQNGNDAQSLGMLAEIDYHFG